jgi:sugar lactone lactonase YvrE
VHEFVATPCTTDLYELGECCRWDDVRGELCWVDVPTGRFFRARADAQQVDIQRTYELPGMAVMLRTTMGSRQRLDRRRSISRLSNLKSRGSSLNWRVPRPIGPRKYG